VHEAERVRLGERLDERVGEAHHAARRDAAAGEQLAERAAHRARHGDVRAPLGRLPVALELGRRAVAHPARRVGLGDDAVDERLVVHHVGAQHVHEVRRRGGDVGRGVDVAQRAARQPRAEHEVAHAGAVRRNGRRCAVRGGMLHQGLHRAYSP
jgi:hypothetical protein